jgi:hypothetical protein
MTQDPTAMATNASAGKMLEAVRSAHFERLNGYRNSSEYAAFARRIGIEPPEGDQPSLLGARWEITQSIYDEFLEMLPPLGFNGAAFFFREFCFDDITTKFTKSGDAYYCEFARFPTRRPEVGTPWGPSRFATAYAPGIVFHSTDEHGGFHLTADRIAEMPDALQQFVPFGGPQHGPGRWFEEDCDWSVVALAFPHLFSADSLKAAHATLQGYRPEVYAAFRTSRPAEEVSSAVITASGREQKR